MTHDKELIKLAIEVKYKNLPLDIAFVRLLNASRRMAQTLDKLYFEPKKCELCNKPRLPGSIFCGEHCSSPSENFDVLDLR